jgi:hypothetical protein
MERSCAKEEISCVYACQNRIWPKTNDTHSPSSLSESGVLRSRDEPSEGSGKVSYDILVDLVVEVEEDAEASMYKDGMCGFGENVIIQKTFFSCRESLMPRK